MTHGIPESWDRDIVTINGEKEDSSTHRIHGMEIFSLFKTNQESSETRKGPRGIFTYRDVC